MLNGAKVLVTGGAGFVGANLILRLISKGCEIRATLHRRPAVVNHEGIEYVKADLTLMEDCRRVVEGVDYIFMCAANTSGAAVIRAAPLVHVTPNVVMNAQMLEAAHFAKVKKFIFISSSVAYPSSGDRPVRESEMFEGEPYETYYCAGWMKRYSEILCKIYAEKIEDPMPTVVIRPSNIYGPYDKFNFGTSHMTAALIRRVVERHNPIEVWGTGDDIRDLIYVDDFLDGILRAFERVDDYVAINIAAGQGYSVRQVLETILEVDDYLGAEVRFDSSKPTTIPIRLVDTSFARRFLDFEATVSLREGIRRTVQWYKRYFMRSHRPSSMRNG